MTKQLKILVLEDNLDDYLLLKEVLDSADEIDVTFLHEEKLANAITALQDQSVDVAIIDLNLPDSFQIDTFLTFHEAYPSIPVIIMTGHKDRETAIRAVNKGAQDYLYKGELSSDMLVRTIHYSIERELLRGELRQALDEIKTLKGILPICSKCKKIRDDEGYWNQIESYIQTRSEALFSHGLCPECSDVLYGDKKWYKKKRKEKK